MRQDASPAAPRNIPPSLADRLRRRAGAGIVDNAFRLAAELGRLHPDARPERHRVERIRDIPYLDDAREEHRLDIYRPREVPPPWPVVLYVHGGGFRILSKDTHWVMALAFARRGYLVLNINYRLAPRHPFPAAVEDASAALRWAWRHAAAWGGDTERLVLAGESAGANLVTALAVSTAWERPEPFAAETFALGVRARAVMAACGILQVTDPERFRRRKPHMPGWVADRIIEPNDAYLRGRRHPGADVALADPLLVLEAGAAPARPLPPFFAPVGTRDPVLDDTRRLKIALERLGAPCDARYYEGEVHAFHAMVMRAQARRCWRDLYAFLDEHIGPSGAAGA